MSQPKTLREFLDHVNANSMVLSPGGTREGLALLANQYTPKNITIEYVEDRVFELSSQVSLTCRIYHPSPNQTLPLIVFFHGGGHVSGDLDTHDAFCRQVAKKANCVLMSIDYRLAPEHPYPCGLEDCWQSFYNRREMLKDLNVQCDQVFLMGDSAGGTLATTVCHRAIEANQQETIKGLVLIYPSLDYTLSQSSVETYGEGYLLTREKIQWYLSQYFQQDRDRRKASPLFFDSLNKFPPVYIATAEFDPLKGEGECFAERLSDCGVQVCYSEFKNMIHAFIQLEQLVQEDVDHLVSQVADFISSS